MLLKNYFWRGDFCGVLFFFLRLHLFSLYEQNEQYIELAVIAACLIYGHIGHW